jgi:hypothetical protein
MDRPRRLRRSTRQIEPLPARPSGCRPRRPSQGSPAETLPIQESPVSRGHPQPAAAVIDRLIVQKTALGKWRTAVPCPSLRARRRREGRPGAKLLSQRATALPRRQLRRGLKEFLLRAGGPRFWRQAPWLSECRSKETPREVRLDRGAHRALRWGAKARTSTNNSSGAGLFRLPRPTRRQSRWRSKRKDRRFRRTRLQFRVSCRFSVFSVQCEVARKTSSSGKQRSVAVWER